MRRRKRNPKADRWYEFISFMVAQVYPSHESVHFGLSNELFRRRPRPLWNVLPQDPGTQACLDT